MSESMRPLSESDSIGLKSHNGSEKVQSIWRACQGRELEKLREFAISEGGLVNDELRRLACTRGVSSAYESNY